MMIRGRREHGFWVCGLALCLLVACSDSSSRDISKHVFPGLERLDAVRKDIENTFVEYGIPLDEQTDQYLFDTLKFHFTALHKHIEMTEVVDVAHYPKESQQPLTAEERQNHNHVYRWRTNSSSPWQYGLEAPMPGPAIGEIWKRAQSREHNGNIYSEYVLIDVYLPVYWCEYTGAWSYRNAPQWRQSMRDQYEFVASYAEQKLEALLVDQAVAPEELSKRTNEAHERWRRLKQADNDYSQEYQAKTDLMRALIDRHFEKIVRAGYEYALERNRRFAGMD